MTGIQGFTTVPNNRGGSIQLHVTTHFSFLCLGSTFVTKLLPACLFYLGHEFHACRPDMHDSFHVPSTCWRYLIDQKLIEKLSLFWLIKGTSQMFSFCLLFILVKSQGGLQPNIFEAVDSNYQLFVFFIPKPLIGQYLAARHLNL